MKENKIKQAFQNIKQDIFSLGNEIQDLRNDILNIKIELKLISNFIDDFKKKEQEILEKIQEKQQKTLEKASINLIKDEKIPEKHVEIIKTNLQNTQTYEDIPADKLLRQVLKRQNLPISIGSQGASTDRQTDRQTDQHIILPQKTTVKEQEDIPDYTQEIAQQLNKKGKTTEINSFDKVQELLKNLNSLRKEIRLKFKRLTNQEIHIFSLIYQLDQEASIKPETAKFADYKTLALKLNISESSIRDHVSRIIAKGIPIIKEKINNKKIILHISEELKKIASLDTIIKLRDL